MNVEWNEFSVVPVNACLGAIVPIVVNTGFLIKEHINTLPVYSVVPKPQEMRMYPINE